MTDAFRSVARGMRLTNIGYLLACWAGAAAFGMFWFCDHLFRGYSRFADDFRWVFIGIFIATLVTIVAGVIVGFVGRIRCLRTPAEFPAVRGRALAAVVLEGSGWGSLLVGIGVTFAMIWRWLPDAPYVPVFGMLFSGLMVLCGRILFLRFLRVLSRVVEDKSSDRRAKSSLSVFLTCWLVGLLGLGVFAGGGALGMYELTTPLAYLIWIVAAGSGLYGLILYDRLLSGLGRSVQAFADATAADEAEEAETGERAYRSRRPEGGSADPDSRTRPDEADTDDTE